jgi:peptide/nickel transport system substrate-binding protein
VKDDYTVVAHLSAWDSQIPSALSREPGFMFSEKAYKEKGEEYCAQHPVGTGPFILKSWDRDVSKTYVKFADYWQGEPKLDKIEYRIYSDSLVAQAALQSGEVQVFFSQDYNQVADMAKKGLKIAIGSIPGMMPFITYESTNKNDPFYDVRVRQAVAHAIDQKTLVNVIYKGYASPTNQFAPTNSPYYNKSVVGYPYSLSKARQLLAQAGYPNGFSTTIAVRNDPVQVACATAIQAEVAKIGVKAKLNVMESGDFSVNMVDWKSGMWFHTTSLPPAIVSQASSMFKQGLSGNVLGLNSWIHPDDINAALENAVSAKTDSDAQKYMQQCQKLLIDKHCILYPVGVLYSSYIKNNKIHDDGINDIYYTQATLWKAWLSK